MIGDHGEKWDPRPDRVAILLRHHAGDLGDVAKVVDDPAGEELPQGHAAEPRMRGLEIELRFSEAPRAQRLEIRRTQGLELVEQRPAWRRRRSLPRNGCALKP